MHKTASSAIQQLFAAEADRLRSVGLRYFPSENPNHSFLLMALADTRARQVDALAASSYRGLNHLADRETLRNDWRSFLAETSAAGEDALLSGEEAGFLSQTEIERLCGEVLRHFDRMIVLGLVRPPLAFAKSATQQRLRGSGTFVEAERAPPTARYRDRFGGYAKAIGQENLRLGIFHTDRMTAGDPAQALLALMDRRDPSLIELRAARLNESMSMPAAKLFSALNELRADPSTKRKIPAPILSLLRDLPRRKFQFNEIKTGQFTDALLPKAMVRMARGVPGPPFVLPIEIQRKILAMPKDDVEWVSSLLGEDLEAFDMAFDESAPTVEEAALISEEETARITRHIMEHMRERAAIIRAALAAAEAREAAA